MEKINFEDGIVLSPAKVIIDEINHEVIPAVYKGNTPLSAFNLNKMQENIETGIKEMIKDELYYKSGDSETFTYIAGGYITNAGTEIMFTVVLPKRLDNVTPEVISGSLYIRTPSGGYLIDGESITKGSPTIVYNTKNIATIRLKYAEKLNITNNTVLGIHITNLKIDFT